MQEGGDASEKTRDKLPSGMRCTDVGREFSVNESTIYTQYGVFKQKYTLTQGSAVIS